MEFKNYPQELLKSIGEIRNYSPTNQINDFLYFYLFFLFLIIHLYYYISLLYPLSPGRCPKVKFQGCPPPFFMNLVSAPFRNHLH